MVKKYLLTIDVGNTATTSGLFLLNDPAKKPHPLSIWTISTKDIPTGAFQAITSSQLRREHLNADQIHDAIISSVVPRSDSYLWKDIKKIFQLSPHFVSYKTPSKISIHYDDPTEVGADRLVNARAAMALWKGPSIVIDFGTATTFDCISSKQEYWGGVIAPGPVISAEALYQKTAKLPMVLLEKPARILGKNTLQSIQSGLYHGYRGLVKEIVTELKKDLGSRTKVFATGGQAHWILKGLPFVDGFYPDLTLVGLYYLWKDISDCH